ncbi:hypothetical protein BH11ACT2_BH11ACT2_05870 [soil metagenome]
MILSDILDRPVFDSTGSRVGFAVDVRFVLHGKPTQLLAGAVFHQLLVSPRTSSSFLGYERSGIASPWPLGRLLERRHRNSYFVDWSDIAKFGGDGVHLRPNFRRQPLRED